MRVATEWSFHRFADDASGYGVRLLQRICLSDWFCAAVVCLITFVSAHQLLGGGVLLGQDWATQFYPWYHYLGERLRDLQMPFWNPYQFSGAPFIADPQSGWTYLPAMVFFTLLPLSQAAIAFTVFHLALAGASTYLLGRLLGFMPIAALAAATVYELSGPVYARSACCPAQVQVSAWIPLLLVGAELAISQRRLMIRWAGVVAGGLALSQILASWLGQGAYYAVLLVGSYALYRCVFDPGRRAGRRRDGLVLAVAVVTAIFILGAGIAAAGLVPRLDYNSLTTLAGGVYESANSEIGGWVAGNDSFATMTQRFYYPGGIAVALALMAPVLSRFRQATPYFLALICASLILGSHRETPLHLALYAVLPKFEELHSHWPERITLIAFVGIAMLTGAAVHSAPQWIGRWKALLAVVAIPAAVAMAFAILLAPSDDHLPTVMVAGVVLAIVAVLLYGFRDLVTVQAAIPLVLVLAIALDFESAARDVFAFGPYGGFYRVDLDEYFAKSEGVAFLESQTEEPFRYFGYNPVMWHTERGQLVLYRYQFASDEMAALQVNNRATWFDSIEDVQGYNPIQFAPYVDYFQFLNGHDQDYHDANVYPNGVDSPLLDLLNARYIIVPKAIPPDRVELNELMAELPIVYEDDEVVILERTSALPRAWMVYEVEQALPNQARAMIATGLTDPATKALLSQELPVLDHRGGQAATVSFESIDPERMIMDVMTTGQGLLVVSEIAHPSWKVRIDGAESEMLTVDGLFRGVVIPPGEHRVEFWYEAKTELLGLAITLVTIVLIAVVSVSVYMHERTKRK